MDYLKHTLLVEHSDQLAHGADGVRTWCEEYLATCFEGIEITGLGALIVPQTGQGSGVPIRLTIALSSELARQVLDEMLSSVWRDAPAATVVLTGPERGLQAGSSAVIQPIARWFDPSVGLLWAVGPSAAVADITSRLRYSATIISLALRGTKAAKTVDVLSRPIWHHQATVQSSAADAAQGCLEALGCKATIVWEVRSKPGSAVLKTIAVVGLDPEFGFDMPVGVGAAGVTALDNRSIVLNDLLDPQDLAANGIAAIRHLELVRRLRLRSAILVPLDIGGRVAGVFAAYAERARAFSPFDAHIVSAFASRFAAGFIHASRLEELTRLERQVQLEAPAIETGILALENIHDAYNSLGIAQAYVSLVRDGLEDGTTLYSYARAVSENVDHSLRILKLLRDGADISKVKLTRNRLSETLEDVIAQVKDQALKARIRISYECPADLKFHYDRWQLARVFRNFLDNSIFFLEDLPRRDRRILIDASLQADKVVISFWDNGPGISEDDLPHIYEYFFTRKAEPRGMGFGLGIARRIIQDNHKGRIEARTRWGHETEFRVSLPYDK